jgi:HPt (histidine-containing phosphotransfer) domain-containing protein
MTVMIDIAHLNQQTFDDPELRREVLGMFLRETPVLLAAIEAGSGMARAEVAHRLKGSALAIGAQALAQCAGDLELMPEEAALLAALKAACGDAMQAAQALMAKPK